MFMEKMKKVIGASIAAYALFGVGQTVKAETPQCNTIEALAQNVQEIVTDGTKTGDFVKTIAHLQAITEENDHLFADQAQLASFREQHLSDQSPSQKATGADLRKILTNLKNLTGGKINYQQIYQDILGLKKLSLGSYRRLGINPNNCLKYFTVAKQIFNEYLIKVQNDLDDYQNGKTMVLDHKLSDSLAKAFFVCSEIYQDYHNVPNLFTADYQDSMIDLYLNFLGFGIQFKDSEACALTFLKQVDLNEYSAQINDKLATVDFSTGTSLNYVQHLLNNRLSLFNLRNMTIEGTTMVEDGNQDVETNNTNFTLVQLHQLKIDYKNQGEVLQHPSDLTRLRQNQDDDLKTCQEDLIKLKKSQKFLRYYQAQDGALIFSKADLNSEIGKLIVRIAKIQESIDEAKQTPKVDEQQLEIEPKSEIVQQSAFDQVKFTTIEALAQSIQEVIVENANKIEAGVAHDYAPAFTYLQEVVKQNESLFKETEDKLDSEFVTLQERLANLDLDQDDLSITTLLNYINDVALINKTGLVADNYDLLNRIHHGENYQRIGVTKDNCALYFLLVAQLFENGHHDFELAEFCLSLYNNFKEELINQSELLTNICLFFIADSTEYRPDQEDFLKFLTSVQAKEEAQQIQQRISQIDFSASSSKEDYEKLFRTRGGLISAEIIFKSHSAPADKIKNNYGLAVQLSHKFTELSIINFLVDYYVRNEADHNDERTNLSHLTELQDRYSRCVADLEELLAKVSPESFSSSLTTENITQMITKLKTKFAGLKPKIEELKVKIRENRKSKARKLKFDSLLRKAAHSVDENFDFRTYDSDQLLTELLAIAENFEDTVKQEIISVRKKSRLTPRQKSFLDQLLFKLVEKKPIDLAVTKQNCQAYLKACKQVFTTDLERYQDEQSQEDPDADQLKTLKIKMKNLFLFCQKIYQQFLSQLEADHSLMFDLVANVENFNYNDEHGSDEVFGDLEKGALVFLSSINLQGFLQDFTKSASSDSQISAEEFKQLLLREKMLFYATSLNNSAQLATEIEKLPDTSNQEKETVNDLVSYLAGFNETSLKFQELEFNLRESPPHDLESLTEYRDNYQKLLKELKEDKKNLEKGYYKKGINLDDYLIVPKGALDEKIRNVENRISQLQDKMQQELIQKQLQELESKFRASPPHDLKSLTEYRDNYQKLLTELKENKENLERDYYNNRVNLDGYLIVPRGAVDEKIKTVENRISQLLLQEKIQKRLTAILQNFVKIKYEDLSKYSYNGLALKLLDLVTSNSNGHQIVRDNYLYQCIINMRKNPGLTSKQQKILDYLLAYLYINNTSDNDNYFEEISQAYQRLKLAVPEEITEVLEEKQKTTHKIDHISPGSNGEIFYQDSQGKAKKIRDARPTRRTELIKIEGYNYSSEAVEEFKQQIEERIRVNTQYQDSVQSKRITSVEDLKSRYDLNRRAFYSANDDNHPECGNLSAPKATDKIVEVKDSPQMVVPKDSGSLFSDKLPDGRIGINPLNIKQGDVGDCYFLSTLFSMVINDTEYLRSMMIDAGEFVYVRFYHGDQPIYYKVSKKLSVKRGAIESSFWVRILEKAVASYRNNPDQQKEFIFSDDSYDGKFDGGSQTDVIDDFYPDNYKGSIRYLVNNSIINHDLESIVTFNRMNGTYSKNDLTVFFGMQQVLSKTGGMVGAGQSLVGAKNRYRDQITAGHRFSVIQCLANQKTAEGDLVNLVTIRNPWGDEVGHGVPKYSQTSSGRWILVPDSKTNNDIMTLELKDFTRLFSDVEMSFDKNEINDKLQIDDVLKTISTLQKSSEAVDRKKEILTASEQYQKLIADLNQFKLLDLNDDRTKAYQILSEFLVNLLERHPSDNKDQEKEYDNCLKIITKLIKNGFYQEAINFMTIYNSHYASGDYNAIITEFTTKLVSKMATVNEEIFKRALAKGSFSESEQQQLDLNNRILDELWDQISNYDAYNLMKVASDIKYVCEYSSDIIDSDVTEFRGWLVYMINWLKELRGKLAHPAQPISIDYDADLTEDDYLATADLNLTEKEREQVEKYNEEISHLREVKTLIESYEKFSSGRVPVSNRANFINEQKTKWQALQTWTTHFYSDHDYLCLLAQAQLDYYERLKQPH